MGGKEKWQTVARDVYQKWAKRPPGSPAPTDGPAMNFEQVLEAVGFADVQSHEFSHPHVWTLDALVGLFFSGSQTSRRALGDQTDAFESYLRHNLLACDPSGTYPAAALFGCTLATRP